MLAAHRAAQPLRLRHESQGSLGRCALLLHSLADAALYGRAQGEYLYGVVRDVTPEVAVAESLRRFLLTTRRVKLASKTAPFADSHTIPARSHDVHTPAHGLACASALLAQRAGVAADPEALYLLDAVRASSRLMLATIENVLTLKVIEADAAAGVVRRMQRKDSISPRALLGEVLDVCRLCCSTEYVLADPAGADLPELLEGDADRVRLALQNGAGAAARYAKMGEPIAVQLHCCDRCDLCRLAASGGPTFGRVGVLVTFDVGSVALNPADAGAAFEPYHSRAGLALLVARAIAHSTDGDLYITSENGVTKFELGIRLFEPGAAAAESEESEEAPSPRAARALTGSAERPLSMQQTARMTTQMLQHLASNSDDMYSTGDVHTAEGDAIYAHVSPSVTRWGLNPADMEGCVAYAWVQIRSPLPAS